MTDGTLHDAFLDELRDAYDAEKQLVRALPKLAKAASSPDLRTAFEKHLEETRGHVDRLERVLPDDVRTVAELPAFLERAHPVLAARLGAVRFAVNEAFADPDTALVAGDVVAVIPPVSGG